MLFIFADIFNNTFVFRNNIQSNLFAYDFAGEQSRCFNLTAALFITLIFNPLKIKAEEFVDSVFTREKYFFDKTITELNEK